MKLLIASSLTALALALPASAQQLEVPRPSPYGKVSQTAGITDITVDYSSPAVRGRQIWGNVVPFDQVWRAGANAATKITFSKDVTIGSTNVPAGSYAFFVIPKKSGPWTLILNKDFNQNGAFNYKQELDVLRVDANPQTIPNRERLAYIVSNFTEDVASIDLEWEKVRVSLPLTLHTDAQVSAAMQAVQDAAWEPYNTYSEYQRTMKKDLSKALTYVNKSIQLRETWRNLWNKAQILHEKGEPKTAYAFAQKAQQLDSDAPGFFKGEIAKALKEWKH